MNSRSYRFIFSLHQAADIPSDFLGSVLDRSFETGIFLPQDDTKWFTEQPDYPARLLLLKGRRLSIISHPDAREPAVALNLDDLSQIEAGQNLLFGWIAFKTTSANYKLTYNTRASDPVDRFVASLRLRWLGRPLPVAQSQLQGSYRFGEEPDLKFRNMLEDALDDDEKVLLQYFISPLGRRRNLFGFGRMSYEPGHLLAVTAKNRLLWLTDEYRGGWGRYAGVSLSSPLWLLQCATAEQSPASGVLLIRFCHDFAWRISLSRLDVDFGEFVQRLNTYSLPHGSAAINSQLSTFNGARAE